MGAMARGKVVQKADISLLVERRNTILRTLEIFAYLPEEVRKARRSEA